jgi:hypothetical protein
MVIPCGTDIKLKNMIESLEENEVCFFLIGSLTDQMVSGIRRRNFSGLENNFQTVKFPEKLLLPKSGKCCHNW